MSGQENHSIRVWERRDAAVPSGEGRTDRVSLPCEPWNTPDAVATIRPPKPPRDRLGRDPKGFCGDCGEQLKRGNASGYCARHAPAQRAKKAKGWAGGKNAG